MFRFVFLPLTLLCANTVAAAKPVVFSSRTVRVNDTSEQTTTAHLVADQAIRQQRQLVDSSRQTMHREQTRKLTVLKIVGKSPTLARVEFGKVFTKITNEDERETEITQPISHQTYFVARDEQGKLGFADQTGGKVTEEEDKLLRKQFETFGKPNPLAQFLDGKRLEVGQSLKVPEAVARELLGLTGKKASTEELVLRLVKTKLVRNREFAVFDTLLRTSTDENTMSMLMKGELVIEAETCRTQSIRLHGPIAITDTRGPTEGRFTVSTNGTLDVNVDTSFAATGRMADRGKAMRR